MMKVSLITPSYPSRSCGISTYTSLLSAELMRLSEVEIISHASNESVSGFLNKVGSAARFSDIVHIQHAFGIFGYMGYLTFPIFSRLSDSTAKVLTTIHELPGSKPQSIKEFLAFPYLLWSIKTIFNGSKSIIVHSKASKNLLLSWKLLDKIQIIPIGLSNSNVNAEFLADRNGIPTIGFFGFISPNKGLHRIIEVLAEIPDVHFRMAGRPKTQNDLKYLSTLEQMAIKYELQDRVEFLGFLPDDDLRSFFESVDVVVFPYCKCTGSMALNYALASNSVVLASELPYFRELKECYDCLETFETESIEQLRRQLIYLLTNQERRNQLVEGTRRFIKETSWNEIAKKTYELYKNL